MVFPAAMIIMIIIMVVFVLLRLAHIEDRKASSVIPSVRENVAPMSTVLTEGRQPYKRLPQPSGAREGHRVAAHALRSFSGSLPGIHDGCFPPSSEKTDCLRRACPPYML